MSGGDYLRFVSTTCVANGRLDHSRLRWRLNSAWMPSVKNWNVVPPFMVIDVRGWLASTKTGVRYKGWSPHHSFQVSSAEGPRTGQNMFRGPRRDDRFSPRAGRCGVLANLQGKSKKTKSDRYTAVSDEMRARANASSTRSGVKG